MSDENNTLGAKQASKKTLKNPLSMTAKGRFEEALLREPRKKDQRLLNCLRRRAPCKPTFLRSTSRASRVT